MRTNSKLTKSLMIVMAIFVAAAMLFGFCYSFANEVFAEEEGTTYAFESGTGTKNDPYVIVNQTQLQLIQQVIEDQKSSSYFEIGADITLDENFVPLGDESNYFEGEINGNGHTISLNINESEKDVVGLFRTFRGKVFNLVLDGSVVGKNTVGALTGIMRNGAIINNVSIKSSVSGVKNVGGISGIVRGAADFVNVVNFGTITSTYDESSILEQFGTGGLIGYADNVDIVNSANYGNVTGKYNVGGLVGYFYGIQSNVHTVFNIGTIVGEGRVGKLAGYNGTAKIENAFATGGVDSFIGDGLKDSNGNVVGSGMNSLSNSVFTNNVTAQVTLADGQTVSNTLAEILNIAKTTQTLTTTQVYNWEFNIDLNRVAVNYKSFWENCVAEVVETAEDGTAGTGFYLIDSAEKLAYIAKLVNAGQNLSGKTVKLTKDINLNGKIWTPIGNSTEKFVGIFDGGNFTVENIYINNIKLDYQGLFGRIGLSALLKNVTVTGDIVAGSYVGGIVGISENSKLYNLKNKATIKAKDSVGGIVGSGSGTHIVNCRNEGNVNAEKTVGGIAGSGGSFMMGLSNSGTITGTTTVGGVLGYMSGINGIVNAYNTGAVSGTDIVGGLIGNVASAKVANAFNRGKVSIISVDNEESSIYGALFGKIGVDSISNVYYLENSCLHGENTVDTVIGNSGSHEITSVKKTTAEFSSPAFLAELNQNIEEKIGAVLKEGNYYLKDTKVEKFESGLYYPNISNAEVVTLVNEVDPTPEDENPPADSNAGEPIISVVMNYPLTWWAILLIVVGAIAVIIAIIVIAVKVYNFKKSKNIREAEKKVKNPSYKRK